MENIIIISKLVWFQ